MGRAQPHRNFGFLELHFGLLALALPVVLAAIAIPLAELLSEGLSARR
jgi:hypothetical protein